MGEEMHSGLQTEKGQVPLQGVLIEASVTGACAEVTVAQRYKNEESVDVEAVYVFPLEEGAAVSGFEAHIGERVVVGRVEEREAAFDAYDDALAEGHGAYLLDQERPNVFTASVGNLRPGQEVIIRLTYVAQLRFEGRAVRLMIPTTVSPRYTPSMGPEVGQPDGERVNPPRALSVPYGLNLSVKIAGGGPIVGVESPSHAISARFQGREEATVAFSRREEALDRDLVLLIETEESDKARALVAREEDGTRVVMVQFRPGEKDLGERSASEVIFLLDCSGSMMGTSIAEARRALALSLRTLSEGDTFNIICFGSHHVSMWPAAKPYNQASLDEASAWLKTVDANLGGTEILSPLKAIAAASVDPLRPRQILLLTDGQVSNEAQVIALCRQQASSTRVFTFGIGAGVSEHLVRGVARASRGAAEFIAPGERIEPKVLRMSGRLSTPALTGVSVDWHGMEVEQARSVTPPVFGGDPLTIFARVKGGSAEQVTLRAGERAWTVAVDLERAQEGGPLPSLWARHRIEELEDKLGQRRGSAQRRPARDAKRVAKIVELGKRYGLMTSHTSYVAIEERGEGERSQGAAELRRVPVALTEGWGGGAARSTLAPARAPAGGASQFFQMGSPSPASQGAMAPSSPGAMAPPRPPASMAPPSPSRRRRSAAQRPPAAAAPLGSGFPKPPARPMMKAQKKEGGMLSSVLGALFGGASAPEEAEEVMASAEYGAPAGYGGTPASKASQDDEMVFFELLMSQKADGRFPSSGALKSWLGSDLAKVTAAAQAHEEPDVVWTVVALALLARRVSDRRDEWSTASTKARRWLAGREQGVEVSSLLS